MNIQGHFRSLEMLIRTTEWAYYWHELGCVTRSFADLGLTRDAQDNVIWEALRARDAILITANRNQDGPNSLGSMIARKDSVSAMPVLTISNPNKISRSKEYALHVIDSLFEHLVDIELRRGTGRLYIP